ncbi:polysaccharide biosynthesis/export family protein [Methylomonas methanica]|uniref:Polysaccharide export protein n=1 Tax=Methylomonas methanica (strain DSM 25384 / MC09) TaxID=857087 RepID=G0A257_METMM|nr:polysaccharide biosynthesis/export family protein [Methylomonas methanica]AEG02600.1 polysaccharide export protein [Methylomonas methanica MC09]
MRTPDFLRGGGQRLAVALLFMITLCVLNSSFATGAGYRINQGDKLRIDVWQEENLHAEVMVSPDGTISFPLVGIVQAAGKTTDELQNVLREQLEQYIPGPEVNISLLTVEGNQVFVIGEVARPGPYVMTANLDVMQALSMAGGLTPFAAKNDIHVVRRAADGRVESMPFAYGDIEDGVNLDSNFLLKSGDTVIIP